MLSHKEQNQLLKYLKLPEVLTFTSMLALSFVHLCLIYTLSSWLQTFFFAITLGAFNIHALYILNVEFAMNLCFQDVFLDRLAGIGGNIVSGVPFAEALRYSQAVHRAFAGQNNDPQQLIGKWTLVKLLLYPFTYLFRMWATVFHIDHFIVANVGMQAVFMFIVWYILGWIPIVAILLSFYFAFCPLHPIAVHFVLEHPGPKSYYGIWNAFTFNVGYHIERHMQPDVPWSRLPLVRQIIYSDRRSQSAKVYRYADLWRILLFKI